MIQPRWEYAMHLTPWTRRIYQAVEEVERAFSNRYSVLLEEIHNSLAITLSHRTTVKPHLKHTQLELTHFNAYEIVHRRRTLLK